MKGPQDEEEESETQPSEMKTSENETKVKVGQIFTDEEYDSLKKVEQRSEESEGIDWGFGMSVNLCFISQISHQFSSLPQNIATTLSFINIIACSWFRGRCRRRTN